MNFCCLGGIGLGHGKKEEGEGFLFLTLGSGHCSPTTALDYRVIMLVL
jgi:hypothetical protein